MAKAESGQRTGSLNLIAVLTQVLLGLLLFVTAMLVLFGAFLMVQEASTESYYYQNVWGFYRFEMAALAMLLLFGIPAAMALTAWTWRAHANLTEWKTPGLNYTPGWAAASAWVPIAGLVVPMRAMRELWNHSHGEIPELSRQSVGLVTAWWTCYLMAVVIQPLLILIVVLPRFTGLHITSLPGANYALFCVSGLMLVLACWNLARIVAQITKAQASVTHVGNTFD